MSRMTTVTILVTIESSTTSKENGFHLRPTATGTCRRRTSPNIPRLTKPPPQNKPCGPDLEEVPRSRQAEPTRLAKGPDSGRECELFSLLSSQRLRRARQRPRSRSARDGQAGQLVSKPPGCRRFQQHREP